MDHVRGRRPGLSRLDRQRARLILVSVTRLRIRSLRFMPGFALYTSRSLRQCRRAAGFHDGSLLPDRRLTFWTMTLWRDEGSMRGFMAGGSHLKAMPRLLDWCDEASVTRWTQDDAALPSWQEADRRMRAQGRPSKVRRPSGDHAAMGFAEPLTSRAVPIRPR